MVTPEPCVLCNDVGTMRSGEICFDLSCKSGRRVRDSRRVPDESELLKKRVKFLEKEIDKLEETNHQLRQYVGHCID